MLRLVAAHPDTPADVHEKLQNYVTPEARGLPYDLQDGGRARCTAGPPEPLTTCEPVETDVPAWLAFLARIAPGWPSELTALLVREAGSQPESEPAVALRVALPAALGDPDADPIALALLRASDTPAWVLDRFAQDADLVARPGWRAALAGHPAVPTWFMVACLSASADVRASLGGNVRCDPVVLARLAGDPEAGVREAVAANPATPALVLCALRG